MSKFTTEVRYICESTSKFEESVGFDKIQLAIQGSARYIFQDVLVSDAGVEVENAYKFPIFDEHYRLPLETKILRHYYTREICEETVGLWKLRLLNRMNEIMPYYNKLYESELYTFNPFYDVDLTRTQTKENTGNEITSKNESEEYTENASRNNNSEYETNKNSNASSVSADGLTGNTNRTDANTHWDLYSDTPQGGVIGINNATDSISNNTYLTDARKVTDNGTSDTSVSETRNNVSEAENTDNESGSSSNTDIGNRNSNRNGNTEGVRALNNTEDYIEHVTGKTNGSVSYSKMLIEFRKSFLNIDKMIIDELSDLFFGLWA